MTGEERRARIVEILDGATRPVAGSRLGELCGVSRQVVVQDVALLRSQGHRIVSTNRGYVLEGRPTPRARRLLKCRHTNEQMADEMNAVVDLGGTMEDVLVNHRTYGVISARLDCSSRRDVARFIEAIRTGRSTPLMGITSGFHFHHISAPSEEVLDEIEDALARKGYLAELTDYERESLG